MTQSILIEAHRSRIEKEHNAGIPFNEWETLEEILEGFMEFNRPCDCAKAYEIPASVLSSWIRMRANRKRKPAKMRAIIRVSRSSADAVSKRICRGMSAIEATQTPIMTPHQRAVKAALSRWGRV